MSDPFPTGYLSYGALSHRQVENRPCAVCKKDMLATTRTQLTHPGECREKWNRARWSKYNKKRKRDRVL